jgi:site-specific DNA-cytosine methylase
MKILVACEESQLVTAAFRSKGHEAYSCDILPTSGQREDWHIWGDVMDVLGHGHNNGVRPEWDMVLAFPPCTNLSVSGARWFPGKVASGEQGRSVDFFMFFTRLHPDIKVAIENPIGIMSSRYRKPDQIVHPYDFGHKEFKPTCLWLTGLPKLKPTDTITPPCAYGKMSQELKREWGMIHQAAPGPDRARLRSRTFQGIANAMAEQWGS